MSRRHRTLGRIANDYADGVKSDRRDARTVAGCQAALHVLSSLRTNGWRRKLRGPPNRKCRAGSRNALETLSPSQSIQSIPRSAKFSLQHIDSRNLWPIIEESPTACNVRSSPGETVLEHEINSSIESVSPKSKNR